MLKKPCLLILTCVMQVHPRSQAFRIEQANVKRFYQQTTPKTYLLSYPRSGNTWVRYSIEFLTKRPTLEKRPDAIAKINCPLGYWFHLGTKYEKDPIWKVHDRNHMKQMGTFNPQEETLILIVRNPKEAIIRHMGKLNREMLNDQLVLNYFDNLALYDAWHPDKRLLIYYEDLISQPEMVYRQLLEFLDESDAYLAGFMRNYVLHKQQALTIYADQEGTPITQGNRALHHSLSVSFEERKAIDEYIVQQYPTVWERYLKDRYQE